MSEREDTKREFEALLDEWGEERDKLMCTGFNIPGVTVDPGKVVQRMHELEAKMLSLGRPKTKSVSDWGGRNQNDWKQ